VAGTDAGDDASWVAAAAATASTPGGSAALVASARHRQRFSLLRAHPAQLLPCLEALKAADLLLVLLPASAPGATSAAAAALLPALRALGAPPALGALIGTSALPAGPKPRAQARKAAEAALATALGGGEPPRVLPADAGADAAEFLRSLAQVRTQQPPWRALRPYVLADSVQFVPSGDDSGELHVCGYVRGASLCADQLAYLPGAGEFQIAAIEAADEPAALGSAPRAHRAKAAAASAMDADGVGISAPRVLSAPVEATRESLQRENAPDPLAGEQTWPTDAEMADADAAAAAARAMAGGKGAKTRLVRRPRGMSDYQAAWIPEHGSDGGEQSEEEEEGEDGDGMPYDVAGDADADGGSGGEDGGDSDGDSMLGEDEMTQDEAMAAARHDSERRLAARRAATAAEAADAEFPDEVDAPLEGLASVRFARYRGLKSFRASPWDAYESLPADYSRVFSFQSFGRTRRRALAGREDAGAASVEPGTYVRCRVAGVTPAAAAAFAAAAASGPAVLLGLLAHEAKLSVAHFALLKSATCAQPLRSKAPLDIHAGFRRFTAAQPVFSQDGAADKFKFERFLRPGVPSVASVFAPITYGPAPVLAFAAPAAADGDDESMTTDAAPLLAATGTLRPADPERIVLKRAVLTGYPHRVHKRKAVIRFMFHNPEDVRWFRPLELWTKYGRHGRIREPLGTHGSLKAAFDGVLQQRDTVCASLYKRIFPKMPPPGP
jgi:pre-rRNA-processing protein TSR1